MEEYEIVSGVPGLRNWRVPVPGSVVIASLGHRGTGSWAYSLWVGSCMVSSGLLDMPDGARADQVARVAYLLDVEYAH